MTRRNAKAGGASAARGRAAWLGVLGLALAARVAVVLSTRGLDLANDRADYVALAHSIAAGHGFGTSHFAPGGGPTALRPPLLPLLLAGVFRVEDSVLAARLLVALLGAAAAVCVGLLGRRLWGPRVGLVAGLLAAVYPPFVLAGATIMSEAPFVLLELLAVLAALEHRTDPRHRWLVACGVALALAALMRPVGLVLALPLVLVATGVRPWRRALPEAAVLLLATAVVLAPWEARDVVRLHSTPVLTTQGGYLLAGTYNATSAHDPDYPAAWRPYVLDPAMRALVQAHPQAGEVETEHLLRSAALDYLRQHPAYLADVVGHNSVRLLGLTGLDQERAIVRGEYGFGATATLVGVAGWWLLVALVLTGIALPRVRRRLGDVPVALWLAPALLVAVTVPVQSFSRFRAPVEPFLLLVAALTVTALATRAPAAPRLATVPPAEQSPAEQRPTQREVPA